MDPMYFYHAQNLVFISKLRRFRLLKFIVTVDNFVIKEEI